MSKDTLHLDSFSRGYAIGVSNLTHALRTMIDQGWTTAELKKYLDAKQVETNAVIDAQRLKETRPQPPENVGSLSGLTKSEMKAALARHGLLTRLIEFFGLRYPGPRPSKW
jgi:hypothetical protein